MSRTLSSVGRSRSLPGHRRSSRPRPVRVGRRSRLRRHRRRDPWVEIRTAAAPDPRHRVVGGVPFLVAADDAWNVDRPVTPFHGTASQGACLIAAVGADDQPRPVVVCPAVRRDRFVVAVVQVGDDRGGIAQCLLHDVRRPRSPRPVRAGEDGCRRVLRREPPGAFSARCRQAGRSGRARRRPPPSRRSPSPIGASRTKPAKPDVATRSARFAGALTSIAHSARRSRPARGGTWSARRSRSPSRVS